MEKDQITELVRAVKDPTAKAALTVMLDMFAEMSEAYSDLGARLAAVETKVTELKGAFDKGMKPL